MALDFNICGSPFREQKLDADLPAIVRDYIENVRGRPEICRNILPDYLDSLWNQANHYAQRCGVPCPIRRDEVDALRLSIQKSTFSHPGQNAPLRG